ncbi:hypothetical protein C1645_835240 [Glomus cerebriforme]|uniref:Uncharacterized protein n=1 Tax=Glomus cerebriforme TaxID=658196 RepID=A0A397S980_9GLOM|nr:hypothetical protein C1645_835240 [Glomus cerebriforme]
MECNDLLSNITLNDGDELLTMKKILKYFPDSPPEEYIHVLVFPPEITTTSDEVLKLREKVASLKEKLNKSEYNVRDVPLEGLKEYICKEYNLPSLEKDRAVLKFISRDKERYLSQNNQNFCKMLQQFILNNNFKLIVVIETSSKAFSDWSFPKVYQLYKLGKSDDPSLSIFLPFTCEYKDLEDDSSQKNISQNPMGMPSRFCNRLTPNHKMVGMTEVKNEDFFKGIAQNVIQLESALSNCKRKANKEGKPSFKLLEPVTIMYKDKNMQTKLEKVLECITWLLDEVQKPDSAHVIGKERKIKRVRSKGNLTRKSDK